MVKIDVIKKMKAIKTFKTTLWAKSRIIFKSTFVNFITIHIKKKLFEKEGKIIINVNKYYQDNCAYRKVAS